LPKHRQAIANAALGRRGRTAAIAGGLCAALAFAASPATAAAAPFISAFSSTTTLASTVPANGDQNPYGIVTVPRSFGKLHAGNILVSNFNNEGPTDANGNPTTGGSQGEGTTIVQFNPDGSNPTLFAQLNPADFPGGVGLTTALAALPNGYVVVGSLPTTDGTSATAKAGALIVLNPQGHVAETLSGGPINGPWDMTSVSFGPLTELFVTNVLNGTVAASPSTVHQGTVVRILMVTLPGIRPIVFSEQVIATGFAERTDPAALVVGPTGVGLGQNGTLYVADTVNSRIAAIPNALGRVSPVTGGGQTLTDGSVANGGGALNGPLGLTIAPNGDVLTANGGDGNLVETTPAGAQVAQFALDTNNGNGAGDLFGLTVAPKGAGVLFVDDFDNTLRLLH
jgi:hypothetical protein